MVGYSGEYNSLLTGPRFIVFKRGQTVTVKAENKFDLNWRLRGAH